MRLIDADALIAEFEDYIKSNRSCGNSICVSVAEVLIETTIDAPTIEQPTWISVEDRLPEKEERILAWNGKGLAQLCRYQYRYNIKAKRLASGFYTDGNKMPYKAKFWMHLPRVKEES